MVVTKIIFRKMHHGASRWFLVIVNIFESNYTPVEEIIYKRNSPFQTMYSDQ